MLTRPSFITPLDFELLKNKCSTDELLQEAIDKIANDYPVQYLIGDVEFMDLKISVNPNVLIPRFETELLVHKTIEYMKKENLGSHVLDLCTGSGCIALSLKKHFPNSKVQAYDKSSDALIVAKANAQLNNINIELQEQDVLIYNQYENGIDVLISNPPYVKLDEEVSANTKYEPQIALYAGDDDIIFYKKILINTKPFMSEKFIIAFEIGATQAERICNFAKNVYPGAKIKVEKDYNNFDRFVFITLPNE